MPLVPKTGVRFPAVRHDVVGTLGFYNCFDFPDLVEEFSAPYTLGKGILSRLPHPTQVLTGYSAMDRERNYRYGKERAPET